ncbi:MAG: UbiA family prenyltransferase [Candidatus Heimdallarchaeota archaeon]|nr:MAG: UbiA family prenyltransferase [Candidatus Heimdallarchaeota archaeon]
MQNNLLFRLRAPNMLGTALLVFTGLVFSIRQPSDINQASDLFGATFIVLSMVFFNIYIWISNDYYDAPYDAEDSYKKTRNVFCGRRESSDYKIGLIVMWFSLIAGLICGGIAGFEYFLFAMAGMLLAYLYSSPTFRAKSRVGFDWIFHVVWFQITFLPLYLYIFGFDVIWGIESKHIQFYSVFLYISLLSLLAQINHQIPDYSIDLQTNQRTTVVALGVKNTITLRYVFYFIIAISVIVICLLNDAILALLMMAAYTLYLLKTDMKKAADVPLPWLYLFVLDYLILSPILSFVLAAL